MAPLLSWEDELELLVRTLPPHLYQAVQRLPRDAGELLEIVLDLGREPAARLDRAEVLLGPDPVTRADLEVVSSRVGAFGGDNRAGIERTLHRISAIRNREGRIVGLTCRVGRAITGRVEIIRDIVVAGHSLLLLGKPGIGKTTMLREVARILADECHRRVVIVDTSNEIAGDGDIPHPGIGRARRMQVTTPAQQHAVMIEAVENHMPEVIIIDEIGTELEAQAARTIAERGVQLVGTAHGNTLDNLLVNPTLNDLLGGIQSVTLSDEEARRRGTQKSVLERKAPPTFDVLVEIVDRRQVAVHLPLADVVDDVLRGRARRAQLRDLRADGSVETKLAPPPAFDDRGARDLFERGWREASPAVDSSGDVVERWAREQGDRALAGRLTPERSWRDRREGDPGGSTARARRPASLADLGPGRAAAGSAVSVFPYGVSRTYLEQAIRELGVPLRIQHHVDDADMVLTLKNYYRRKDSPLRAAEAEGVPISVLRSNTVAQIRELLGRLYEVEAPDPTDAALREVRAAIERARLGEVVELAPQNAYVRRLQHQLVEQHDLVARSTGKDPRRRLRVYGPAAS
ncbi:MAG TPA: R3H domain-containing nucleic acid-binding protein [Verrucomicrobiae bacterium]|nr:R3H domain-containing nucleic acid-binding protein [Verrucomicrobiae bacterium]